MKKRRWLIALGGVAVVLTAGAGSCDRKGLGDAPVGERLEDERTVIVMPDQFPNMAIVCDGPTRIYVTTRDAPPVLVPDHPACEGERPLDEQGRNVPEGED